MTDRVTDQTRSPSPCTTILSRASIPALRYPRFDTRVLT